MYIIVSMIRSIYTAKKQPIPKAVSRARKIVDPKRNPAGRAFFQRKLWELSMLAFCASPNNRRLAGLNCRVSRRALPLSLFVLLRIICDWSFFSLEFSVLSKIVIYLTTTPKGAFVV
jgi:hypothetical protein